MKKTSLFIFLFFYSNLFFSQNLYNPQQLYETPGGLFDEDSVREIYLDFYDPNYHNYLVKFSEITRSTSLKVSLPILLSKLRKSD